MRGRVGIFELLLVSDAVRHHIQSRLPAARIKAAAVAEGTKTLRDDGIRKVLEGITTIEEVERALGRIKPPVLA